METPRLTWREQLQKWFDLRLALAFVAAALIGIGAAGVWLRSHKLPPSAPQFGEIWQVYSFHPDVSATAYNSPSGNATIIWISGMDYEESPSKTLSF